MTLRTRIRNAWRYFRSLSREPVSAQTYAQRKRETTAKLRREIQHHDTLHRIGVLAVAEALREEGWR